MNERVRQYQRHKPDQRGIARGQAGYFSHERDISGVWPHSLSIQQGALVLGGGGSCGFPDKRTWPGDHSSNWGKWPVTKLIPAAIILGFVASEAVNWTIDTAAMVMRAIGAN